MWQWVFISIAVFFYLLSSPHRSQHDENNDISGVKPENKTKYTEIDEKSGWEKKKRKTKKEEIEIYTFCFSISEAILHKIGLAGCLTELSGLDVVQTWNRRDFRR